MESTDKVRSAKLTFKGEKTKKKRKRDDREAGGSSRRRRRDEEDKDPETWVLPENPNEIRGPT
jgi:protein FRG1